MRPLDRRIGVFQQTERLGIACFGLIAPACIPQEPADLATDTGCHGMIARAQRGAKHHLVMTLRCLTPADRTTQIGDAFAEHKLLGSLLVSLPQRGKVSLIVAYGIVVGIR